jgi:NitT/TauT family transport system permease protein
VVVSVFDVPAFLLPAPLSVAETIFSEWPTLSRHAVYTTQGFGLGFLVSVAIGIPLAVAMAFSRLLSRTIYPLIVTTQALPKVALAPLFLVWFGFGLKSQVLIVFLIAFFPILINTMLGLQAMPRELYYLALSMGGRPIKTFFKIRLPLALPSIWAGLKLAVVLAVVGAVVGEFVAANQGLGFLVNIAAVNIQTALAFATLTVLASLAIVAFLIVEGIGRLVIPHARNIAQ